MKAYTDVIESFKHNTLNIDDVLEKPHLIRGISTFISKETGHNIDFVRGVVNDLYILDKNDPCEQLPREQVRDFEEQEPWA